MSVIRNGTGAAGLKLKILEHTPAPWHLALLPVPNFPVPSFYLEQINAFLYALDEVLVSEHGLCHEILYQVWKLTPRTGGDVISENIVEWSTDLGLGIWPHRRPPQSWTEELMVDAAAAVFRGDEPELPSHRLLLLKAEARKRIVAADKMRGFGVQIELFSKETIDRIQERGKSMFLPTIREGRFQRDGFYLPVLDCKGIAAAESAEKLSEWLCGIEVYVRESAEDRGILILSRYAIDDLVEQVRRRLENERLGG